MNTPQSVIMDAARRNQYTLWKTSVGFIGHNLNGWLFVSFAARQ
jgi:hypothetical protein